MSVLFILKYLLRDQNEFHKLIKNIELSINKLSKELNCVTIDEVLTIMGFPKNWSEVR